MSSGRAVRDRHALSADGSAPYRSDIDGLRALAILLVVVYPVWLGRVSGGVDVFLMISAFFLTASFVRRMRRGASVGVGTYWLRKFRRLIPAAAVTLLGVLATAFVAYPPTMWPELWRQTWTSLFYVQNWQLAFGQVDYYARDESTPSPLQHFWSLSVQGQVFIIWPLIFLAVGFVVRRTRLRPVGVLAVVFGLIFAASLAFSIIETATSQSFAYFDTRTRLWEFAAGSLVALALPIFRAPARARALLGWLGVIGIVACGIVIDVRGGFPGYLALWPVLCTAAVILAGSEPAAGGPSALLSSRPVRFLGRDAYALYLVHWPVLITWLIVTNQTRVGPLAGMAIIAISFVLARLVAVSVENPVRRFPLLDARPMLGAAVIVAFVAAVAIPLTVWQVAERVRVEQAAAQFAGDYPGAAALPIGEGVVVRSGVPLMPDPTAITDEWVALDSACDGAYRPTNTALAGTCVQRVTEGESSGTVVVVGDSHAQQWMAAVLPIAAEQGWDVVALLKGGCSFAAEEAAVPGVEGCPQWREAAQRYIARIKPIAVFGMATKTEAGGSGERALDGIERTLDRLSATGAEIVLFRDNPRFARDVYKCVIRYGPDSGACRGDRQDHLAPTNPARGLGSGAVHVIDLSDYLCPAQVCPAVIGNVAVYLDDNHLTRMYATTLAPVLARDLSDVGLLRAAG